METPRTDKHLRIKEENGHVVIVSKDFARQLETELVDKEKQLAEAQELIKKLRRCENMTIGVDHYAKLTNENAEMYAVLKVCKGYFEEMGLCEDSVTYKMICAALEAAEKGEKK